jgi:hypothetical protein
MAKAMFQKGQRVLVRPVGVWSTVDRVIPQWVKGVEEPLRIHYDVGLGRDFAQLDLVGEDSRPEFRPGEFEHWRVLRARGGMQLETLGDRTYPVVVTDQMDWGGWRVPEAEYDCDPDRIEHQARVMANSLRLFRLARDLVGYREEHATLPPELEALAQRAQEVLSSVYGGVPDLKIAAE